MKSISGLFLLLFFSQPLLAQIDLYASVVGSDKTTVTAGQYNVDVYLSYREVNKKAVGAFKSGVYLSQNRTFEKDLDIDLKSSATTMSAGTSSVNLSFYVNIPSTILWPSGTVYILHVLDVDGVIAETDETNNVAVSGAINYTSSITGLHAETESASSLQLYPNPAVDYLEIGGVEVQEVKIFDLHDKLVLSSTSSSVALSSLRVGLYVAHVLTPKGTMVKRFVKK